MFNAAAPEFHPSAPQTPDPQSPSKISNDSGHAAELKRRRQPAANRQHPKTDDSQSSAENSQYRSPARPNQSQSHDRQSGAPSDVPQQRQHQKSHHKTPLRTDSTPNQSSPSSHPKFPRIPVATSHKDQHSSVSKSKSSDHPKSKRYSTGSSAASSSQPLPPHQHEFGEDTMVASKFITIADPIDPVLIIHGSNGTTTLANGCDVYVDWVERSLKAFDQVVLIGIDQALANVVAIVNILEQSGLGGHHDLETFTVEEPKGTYKSCIQFKLHRGPALENEVAQKRNLQKALSRGVGSSGSGPVAMAGK
ncbi:hypothetical protein BC938DRAFT_479113 [Jimgerdemannia flammicorona]|uniref:Uncharacterized protein n=1 Tax=Jimgerdemannia flammicorona TaxID=994334 RepID=A0A433QLJ8_9FUNG|nr:hypothetical protein BC938DRAFT_479113 [Jimgerdemannia flammicorona]